MSTSADGYARLIERIGNWAEKEANVRAAVIIGSRARADHPADEWSDLDVVVLARDPDPYVRGKTWLEAIGALWLSLVEPSPDGRAMERRVLFAGGLDVDFAFSHFEPFYSMLVSGQIPPDVGDMLRRGYRFLVDKEALAGLVPHLDAPAQPPEPPTRAEFLNSIHDFWYHTLWTAKHLRRGELWWAKAACDIRLKLTLQQMLEWHARATNSEVVDTWLRGRFLEEWADPRAVAALSQAFGHYDTEDVWRALLATMYLFAWLESETAAALRFSYPTEGATAAAGLVRELYAERTIAELAQK